MSETKQKNSISVFFPAYNDANTIGKMVEDALEILPRITDGYEVIVIDDGSHDETANVLNRLSEKHSRLRIVTHENNKGYGGALRSGFETACKDLIFYTDGDAQYDAKEMVNLIPLMKTEIDIVNGYKIKRGDGFNRKIIGGLYNRTARLLFGLPVRDVDCDFRLIRKSALEKISLNSSSGSICVELIYKLKSAGCKFDEIPVHHYPRLFGQSQFFTFKRIFKTLRDFFSLWLKLVVFKKDK